MEQHDNVVADFTTRPATEEESAVDFIVSPKVATWGYIEVRTDVLSCC